MACSGRCPAKGEADQRVEVNAVQNRTQGLRIRMDEKGYRNEGKISPAETKKTVGWTSRPQNFRHPACAGRELCGLEFGGSRNDKTRLILGTCPDTESFFLPAGTIRIDASRLEPFDYPET